MPVNWDPGTFEEFCRAYGAGDCEVVLHRWTRGWARGHGWSIFGFYSERWFIRRLTASEQDFWQAYKDGAFNLYLRDREDPWGR